jgi:proteasome accessory factor C
VPVSDAGSRLRQLLLLVPWLAGRGEVPLEDVAARFHIPEHELVPLLERAACCGLPPYTPDVLVDLVLSEGTVRVEPGRQLDRPRRLSAAEGFALSGAARALLALPGADPDGPLASAAAKLDAVLGARTPLVVEVDEPPLLAAARAAAVRRERLAIVYYAATRDELTERVVDPIAVYTFEGHWYLDAWCHRARGLRHFRVDRIRSLDPAPPATAAEGSPSAAEGSPTVAGAVASAMAQVGDPLPADDASVVTLSLSPRARWVCDTYRTSSVQEDGDRLVVRLAVGGPAWLERLLLRLGPEAILLDPPELADLAGRAAARVRRLYGDAR